MIFAATCAISPDEPCFNLSELNRYSPPPDQVLHRYQILIVVRGEMLAEYDIDLGAADQFTAAQFRLPGGISLGKRIEILHTVAELQEMADFLRSRPFSLPFQPRDLVHEYREHVEEAGLRIAHQSTFGPLGHITR